MEAMIHTLPSELSSYTVAEVHAQLLERLQSLTAGQPLWLDAAAVSDIDGAGIQLLLALAASMQARGLEFQLLQASPAVHSAAQTLGCGLLAGVAQGATP